MDGAPPVMGWHESSRVNPHPACAAAPSRSEQDFDAVIDQLLNGLSKIAITADICEPCLKKVNKDIVKLTGSPFRLDSPPFVRGGKSPQPYLDSPFAGRPPPVWGELTTRGAPETPSDSFIDDWLAKGFERLHKRLSTDSSPVDQWSPQSGHPQSPPDRPNRRGGDRDPREGSASLPHDAGGRTPDAVVPKRTRSPPR